MLYEHSHPIKMSFEEEVKDNFVKNIVKNHIDETMINYEEHVQKATI